MNKALTVLIAFFILLNSALVFAEEQPWDFLRPLDRAAVEWNPFTTWIVFLLATALVVISFLAYKKKATSRYAFIALAFGLFGLKWALKVIDLYMSPGHFVNWAIDTVFDLLILTFLFLALLKR